MKLHANMTAGILGILLSVVVWVASAGFPVFELKGAGPEFYPRFMALLLTGLSILLIFQGAKAEPEKSQAIDKTKLRQLLVVLALVIVYYLFLKKIGYFVTTFVVCTLVALVLFGKPTKKTIFQALINSTLICGAIFVVFRIMLKAPLPHGLLF